MALGLLRYRNNVYAWLQFLRISPALVIAEDASQLPSYRKRRLYNIFAAARGFAPESCHEALKIWEASNKPCAPVQREYWRGICEFVPLGDELGNELKRNKYAVSAAYAKRFLEALQAEQLHKTDEALDIYMELSDLHALAAARVAFLRNDASLMDGWRRYMGKINAAVAALQCYAIARVAKALRLSIELGNSFAALTFHTTVYRYSNSNNNSSTDQVAEAIAEKLAVQAAIEDATAAVVTQHPYYMSVQSQEGWTPWLQNPFVSKCYTEGLPTVLTTDRIDPLRVLLTLSVRFTLQLSADLLAETAEPVAATIGHFYSRRTRQSEASRIRHVCALVTHAVPTLWTPTVDDDLLADSLALSYTNERVPPAAAAAAPTIYANDFALSSRAPTVTYANDSTATLPTSELPHSPVALVSEAPATHTGVPLLWKSLLEHCATVFLIVGGEQTEYQRKACASYCMCVRCAKSTGDNWCYTAGKSTYYCSVCIFKDPRVPPTATGLALLLLSYDQVNSLVNVRGELLATFDSFASVITFLDLLDSDPNIAAIQLCSIKYFHGRISKEEAEALVLARAGNYLLRWSSSMVGVYFIVVCKKDGNAVRHVQLERVADNSRRVALQMPREEAEGDTTWERREYPSLLAAMEAARIPYRLKHAVLGPYYRALRTGE